MIKRFTMNHNIKKITDYNGLRWWIESSYKTAAAAEGYNLGQKCAILALNSTINAIRYNQEN